MRPASFATRISSAPTAPMAENFSMRRRWRARCGRNGLPMCGASRMWSAPAANRCCSWTVLPPPGIDWICVSPKADAEQKLKRGNELKLVYPQEKALPERFVDQDFANFFLQPMDNPERTANTEAATAYCLSHPQWRLSLQTHKLLGIP
jgi:hypothetical protein